MSAIWTTTTRGRYVMRNFVQTTAKTAWHTEILARNARCKRLFFLISGYNQSAMTWEKFQESVILHEDDGVAIICRREYSPRRYVGLTSLADQINEVEAAILWLMQQPGFANTKPFLIGHSVGGLIAREIVARNTDMFEGLMQIAPVPTQRFALLTNWSFWRNGGFIAAFMALWGIVNGRGFVPPPYAVQGLYTGAIPEEMLDQYMRKLIPDSVRVFIELLFFYDGREAWDKVTTHMHGTNVILVAPNDTIIPERALKEMGAKYLFYLSPGTPHCIEFTCDELWKRNARISHLSFCKSWEHKRL